MGEINFEVNIEGMIGNDTISITICGLSCTLAIHCSYICLLCK